MGILLDDCLILYVLILVVSFIILRWFNVRVWSCITLSLLIAVAILMTVYSPTRLISERMCPSVFVYVAIIAFSLILIFTYSVVKCVNDIYDEDDLSCLHNDGSIMKKTTLSSTTIDDCNNSCLF